MVNILYDADTDIAPILTKQIAIIGYGSQGHAHALNLRDSGCHVCIGLPEQSKSRQKAEQDGWSVLLPHEAAAQADVIMLLVPDQVAGDVYRQSILPQLSAGKLLLLAHGFALHFGQIQPREDIDVAMVAPNGPGVQLRHTYSSGAGIPALWTICQDASGQAQALTHAYAHALGCTRVGIIETTLAEETETDLFAEQVVLCGGLTTLIRTAFETLVEAGYQPEVAYTCCLQEVKLISDLLYQGGIHFMHNSISDTAEYGDYVTGPRIIDEHTREQMRGTLRDIQDGTFSRNWIQENLSGRPRMNALRRRDASHLIEQVGTRMRAMNTTNR